LKPLGTKECFGKLFVPLLLLILFSWISYYKIHCSMNLPFYSPDGDCFYWTENAFHYRYAEMVADGKAIPPLDIEIQYPEGLDTTRYITAVMERVAGNVHRLLFRSVPLHVFLVYFSSIFSTVSVLAVYWAGALLWRSKWAGLVCAFFYCVGPASFVRSASGAFIREDFALPFIFFSFACFLYCLRKDSPLIATIGSLLLVAALAAWHLTQFYLLLFVGGFVVIFLLQKKEQFPRLSFTILTIAILGASVGLPVLRAKQTVFSFPLMLSYGLSVSVWLLHFRRVSERKKRLILAGSVIVIFLVAGLIIQRYFLGGYSYIYQFVLSKFRYLGRLPDDPRLLPFEIKVTWTASFVRPHIGEVFFLLSSALLFGAVTLVRQIFRILKGKADSAEIMTAYFGLVSFLLFLLIHRLSVFAIFFLVLPVGCVMLVKDRTIKLLSYAGIAVCVAFAVFSFANLRLTAHRPAQRYVKDVISFLRENTGRDEAVLSSFAFGPVIAAYADRPVILHSKFESKPIRDKVEQFYTALYQSEEDFYRLCRQYNVKLFVFQADMVLSAGPGSIRYVAGATGLRRDCAAALFHFTPERLKHFELIHQNGIYRIFRVAQQ